MKTLILGAGAMGCLFGAKLKQAGFDVTLYNRENETIKLIEKQGIQLITASGEQQQILLPVVYQAGKLKKEYDLIIVLIKAFATEVVISDIQHIIGENTMVLSLQNGVGNLEKMQQIIPHADFGVGGTGSGASVLGPGIIAHRGTGKTNIGFIRNKHPEKYNQVSQMLSQAGLETNIVSNVQSVIWSKLLINVAFNSLTAVTRLLNGDIIVPQAGEELFRGLITEAVEVAKAADIELLYEDPVNEILTIGHEQIARNQSSMLTDVINERQTEIEVMNGAIVTYGKKYGIPTPYNQVMTNLIEVIESSYPKQIGTSRGKS